MKATLKEKFPNWCLDNNKYIMCITDDIDSLFSSKLLEAHKGYTINYFYDFKKLYRIDTLDQINKTKSDVVAIDMAVNYKMKAFDNHVTLLNSEDEPNPNSANLNNIYKISRNKYYFYKYAMSTLLTVVSLYDIFDYKQLTDEQKLVLWAIDSSYLGFYQPYERDQFAHKKYREFLELEELASVLYTYQKSDFIEVIQEYKLNEKICIDQDGYLKTGIALDKLQSLFSCFNLDFSLPSQQFTMSHEFSQTAGKQAYLVDNDFLNKCFSHAFTGQRWLSYTMI